MTQKHYTFMVLPGETTRIRKFTVAKRALQWVAAGCGLLALVAVFVAADYVRVRRSIPELERLRMETRNQKQQLVGFAQTIEDIQGEMTRLRNFDTKLRVMANLDVVAYPDQIMGIGGQDPEPFNPMEDEISFQDKALIQGMTDSLTRLQTETSIQERSLQELVEYLEDQKSLLASTPSIWPVKGWVTSGFSYRTSPFTGRREMHTAIDIATRIGTPIISPADGLVVFTGMESGYGNMVAIDHGYGLVTKYGHLSAVDVKRGQKVKRGDIIARVGNTGRSTGSHLHYEVLANSVNVNPLRYILN